MTGPMFDTVALIGIGLIGGSIARGIREHGLARRIVCVDASAQHCAEALELGLVDEAMTEPGPVLGEAGLVILAIPLGAMRAAGEALAPFLKPGTIVSDTGSSKQSVIDHLGPLLPAGVHLVPAHPVAGTENSGPKAGFASLFRNRWCIITPAPGSDPGAIERLSAFWRVLGSKVEIMDAHRHDLVLAITSHVPHLIAYNIVGTADDLETVTHNDVIRFSAGGFRDFTRIAASDPVMWRDVFLNNRNAVLEMLGRFTEDLFALQRAIRWSDGQALQDLFTRTRAIRREIIDAGQETAAPDFGRAADKN
jgi:cyclohexadieny/prephenate dehydrogenase